MKALKTAAGSLGVTMTLPNSYWYLQGFDIVNIEPNVDWFNVMSYDIHGTWDGSNP
jgi:chitinase